MSWEERIRTESLAITLVFGTFGLAPLLESSVTRIYSNWKGEQGS